MKKIDNILNKIADYIIRIIIACAIIFVLFKIVIPFEFGKYYLYKDTYENHK